MPQLRSNQLRILFIAVCFLGTALSVSGQTANGQVIAQRVSEYTSGTLQEKVFVHTDRTAYVPGDIIWFKIYCVDESSQQPTVASKVAYVDILDKDRQPILQAAIDIKGGTGSGSLMIPPTIASGNFLLRAYTSWMKNFDPEYYYHQKITILNTIKADFKEAAVVTTAFDAQFFPEGGSLVDGLETKVAFRVTDQTGKGVPFIGVIVAANHDTIVQFQPANFGIGNFIFTPHKGIEYKALLKTRDGTVIPASLPGILTTGYGLQVSSTQDNSSVNITVRTNTNETSAWVLIHSAAGVKAQLPLVIKNGVAVAEVDKSSFGEGISTVTVFDANNKPRCERLFFVRPQQRLVIKGLPDNTEYNKRKKVLIQVSAGTETGEPLTADMSLAVFRLDSLTPFTPNSIDHYFWLASELKGNVESPSFYFRDNSPETIAAADNLMLTHGWRRFNWDDVLNNKRQSYKFLPEFEGHVVTGKIVNKYNELPVPGVLGFLSVPGPHFQLYAAKSDEAGNIYFNTRNFYGPSLLVGLLRAPESDLPRLDFASPFSENFSSWRPPGFTFSNGLAQSLLQRSIGTQVEQVFAGQKRTVFETVPSDTTPFFGRSRFRYLLDDYTRFPTMEEVLREYVREVNVRRRRDNFTLTSVTRDDFGLPVIKEPVVLLDGVPQFDNGNKISHYDPLKVKKLEVVQDKYFLGPASFDGIISFTTYNGDLSGFRLDSNSTALDYEGLQFTRTFYSPRYETADQFNSRVPDFRSLLYWSPDVKTGVSGKTELQFYTSDRPGKYAVVLQGMTATGQPGAGIFTIEVKP